MFSSNQIHRKTWHPRNALEDSFVAVLDDADVARPVGKGDEVLLNRPRFPPEISLCLRIITSTSLGSAKKVSSKSPMTKLGASTRLATSSSKPLPLSEPADLRRPWPAQIFDTRFVLGHDGVPGQQRVLGRIGDVSGDVTSYEEPRRRPCAAAPQTINGDLRAAKAIASDARR